VWSSATLQYLRVRVKAVVNGADFDPSGDVVQFGFVATSAGSPSTVPGSWVNGVWETDTISGETVHIAKVLVGPSGSFVPSANTAYFIWLKISSTPEQPVLAAGTLTVS